MRRQHLQVKIEDIVAEGDRVAESATWTGAHRGVLPMIPVPVTGRRLTFTGIVFWRVRDGKIYRTIKNNTDWLAIYNYGVRAVTYVGKDGSVITEMEPTMPCCECNLLLPFNQITIDHAYAQKVIPLIRPQTESGAIRGNIGNYFIGFLAQHDRSRGLQLLRRTLRVTESAVAASESRSAMRLGSGKRNPMDLAQQC